MTAEVLSRLPLPERRERLDKLLAWFGSPTIVTFN
jgi:hypothetical protein